MADFKVTKVFKETIRAFVDGKRRCLNEGGTSSSKSYSIIQALIYIAQESKTPMLISIISESLPHLKRGCIRDFFNILGESQDNNPYWSKTEFKYKKPGWKGEFEFFGADEETKMRGGRRDILFVNEGNNIAWEAVRQADIRTQRFTLVDWNPSGEFWVYEYWMDKPTSDKKYFSETGYVQEFGDNVLIHSTYMDAREVIPLQTIKDIEAYKDTDPDWWRVYGLGELGKMDGLVYPSFEIVDEMPLGSFFCGLDFGFTNDPAALSVNTIIDDELYSKQLIYKRGLTNDVLAREMDLVEWKAGGRTFRGVTGLQLIADSAEPKSIEEIRRKGFNIIPCEKGKGSVEYGIQKVNQYRHYITKDSVEGIKEYRNLRYKKDKLTGQFTDKFVGEDHFCDSVRYAVSTRRMLGSRLPIGVSKRSSLVIDKVYNGFRLPISLNRR
jgi:phage terminase large subunit